MGTSVILLFNDLLAASDMGVLDILRDVGRCRVARAIRRTSAGARKVRRPIIIPRLRYAVQLL